MRNVWKWLGLAGAVGVTTGGVLVARDQRQRNSYSADDVRDRLRQRYESANNDGDDATSGNADN
ncbi:MULTISPECIES: hypothetical protein [unclassified Gordonia (in: high G+C Gram-positive bacteria)]|uniref:hypothetical protein n=1 Tax=unclassified Gordonia (in: high G+C Gram-positive bacteria) TaxID=2657482 RepID=UPI001F0F6A82|nr:hypothetical protein [Gordonia sp. ABSL49_1]MCH5643669.1 hypothetical protein [Gordonia sp. ABSL49_1]